MDVLKETYPYSLEVTKVAASKRTELVTELELLKRLDSTERMMVLKSDELEHMDISPKDFSVCRELIPTKDMCENLMSDTQWYDKIEIVYPDTNQKILTQQNWNILRQTISNMEFSQSPGRSLFAFVGFNYRKNFKLLGLIQLRSDAQNLSPRDNHIGWTEINRKFKREHVINMSTCVPTQPFGTNHLGGKFLSVMATEMIGEWEKRYKQKVIGITTSSLHGKPNQYDGMKKYWKSIGYSSGEMVIKPRKDNWAFWREWLRTNYRETYDDCKEQSSPTQSMVSATYRLLGLKISEFKTQHERPYYLFPVYENYIEFLNGKANLKELLPVENDWKDWFHKKSTERYQKLKSDNQLQTDILFHERVSEDEIEMWLSAAGKN